MWGNESDCELEGQFRIRQLKARVVDSVGLHVMLAANNATDVGGGVISTLTVGRTGLNSVVGIWVGHVLDATYTGGQDGAKELTVGEAGV